MTPQLIYDEKEKRKSISSTTDEKGPLGKKSSSAGHEDGKIETSWPSPLLKYESNP